jgi:predicted membrane GTPase involved in stress response
LAYKMIAERENDKVRIERESSILIAAKAKVFASEGWQVVIQDDRGHSFAPADFERAMAA